MFADVVLSTESLVLMSGMGSVLTGAIYALYRSQVTNHELQIAAMKAQYDAQITDLKDQRKSYQEIADESTRALEYKVNELRGKKGKPPTLKVAPIVPEHSSPVSETQQATADLQTIRARLTAAVLELGLPARKASPTQQDLLVAEISEDLVARQERVADIQEAAADKIKDAADQQEATAKKLDDTLEKHDPSK